MGNRSRPRVVLATGNRAKVTELQRLLDGLDVELVTSADLGLPGPVEDGATFEANALLKARAAASVTGQPTIADDSGLEVDALEGAPGVHSARWSGGDDEDNNDLLLARLSGVPDAERTARFVAAVAVVASDGREWVERGTMEGRILRARRGSGGFGYDPLFVADGHERSNGELTPAEKNAISHRAVALRAIRPVLVDLLEGPDAS